MPWNKPFMSIAEYTYEIITNFIDLTRYSPFDYLYMSQLSVLGGIASKV